MEKIFVGKYVNTHGIKGEIRIKSNFKFKDKVFVIGNKLYINNQEFIINSYRIHKGYDMVTFTSYDDINKIIDLKGSSVYIDKDSLKLDDSSYLDSDLIGFSLVMNDINYGKVTDIYYLNHNKKLLVLNNKLIPFELMKKIDFKNKIIILSEVDGLL